MKPLEELLEIAKSVKEEKEFWVENGSFTYGCTEKREHLNGWKADGLGPWNVVEKTDFIATFNPQTVIDLITQLKDAQAEIKSLNTFNTQFTRADKISWGGLYIQVEQLEQRLAECETALKKALEFGEYAEWAINESKDLQQLDIDARAYLSKWGVK